MADKSGFQWLKGVFTPMGCYAACMKRREADGKTNAISFGTDGNKCFCQHESKGNKEWPNWLTCYLPKGPKGK